MPALFVVLDLLLIRFFHAAAWSPLIGYGLLGLLLSPAAPHLLGRVRLHLLGTLEFPILWLTMMLLLVGGVTAALYALFPFTNGGLSHLLLSLLVYAPAARYLSLGFLATDRLASDGLLSLARSHPTPGIVVGHRQVREESTGKVTEA